MNLILSSCRDSAPVTPSSTARRPYGCPSRGQGQPKSAACEPKYLAHDARNWLTVLQVYCDLLRSSGAVTGEYQKWVDELSGAVERGQDLVTTLLDVIQGASAEAPDAHLRIDQPPSLDLADALKRRLPMLRRLAGDRIEIELAALPGSGRATISEGAFERVLQNLLTNAVEAMPEGGRISIAVVPRSARQRAGRAGVLLRISDTGKGISPDRLQHVFEPGFTEKRAEGDTQLHGCGLAIIRELVERAGGSIRVRSTPGKGTSFGIELPAA